MAIFWTKWSLFAKKGQITINKGKSSYPAKNKGEKKANLYKPMIPKWQNKGQKPNFLSILKK